MGAEPSARGAKPQAALVLLGLILAGGAALRCYAITTRSLWFDEAVTAFTVLDSGLPPAIGPGSGNVPQIVDATAARDVVFTGAALTAPTPWVQPDSHEDTD